jgi:acetylornithine/N-succinyldiaminopimelate aminotransferase
MMKPFDVYPLFDIEPVLAQGFYIWDRKGDRYLDFYGGHAVISIGHSHPEFVENIKLQLDTIAFYSNSVYNKMQHKLSEKLGLISGYEDYNLFLCNSGAEANENALKLASFSTGRSKVLAFHHAFHGRTSAAVAVTDNPKIVSPFNQGHQVVFAELNDLESVEFHLMKKDVCAVIIEGIQGVAGIILPSNDFMVGLRDLCTKYGTKLIVDEVQSGYGRSGKFFAHQHAGIRADIITTAKGMGNGFPIGGVLIHPSIEPKYGMLGSTFGGNYLACAAAIAVINVIQKERLIENAEIVGNYLIQKLLTIDNIGAIRGKGLMIGIEFDHPMKEIRDKLLHEYKIFTGASGANVIRLLPPLTITEKEADVFIQALNQILNPANKMAGITNPVNS